MRKMKVNEIFYSLQGEGFWTGTPMVFVRFSGCNLDCAFCDTDHSSFTDMSLDEIVEKVASCGGECRRICATGGEPSLQIGSDFINAFHMKGYKIHIETNGTMTLPDGIDWITVSPKTKKIALKKADEIKLVYLGQEDISSWNDFPARFRFLQPCSCKNTKETIDWILENPQWRLSLQTQKYLDIR